MKTLIVGCSFCATLGDPVDTQWKIHPDITTAATSGTGNRAISARILHECSKQKYDKVIVVWTGINRLDTVIPRLLFETYPGALESNPLYSFCTPLVSEVWYHSGGIGASWVWDDNCPKEIKNFFKTQYIALDPRYLTDNSLTSIINTQSFLDAQNIDYDMSFIYDINADYSNLDGGRWENVLGKLYPNSNYTKLINWDKIKLDVTPFEWARKDPTRLEGDQFHPTRTAMREWINLTFDIDIAE